MTLIKTVAFNIVLFFALMFVLLLIPPTYFTLRDYFAPRTADSFAASANMPALRDYDWARDSMWETYLVRLQYRDYIVQRGTDIAGKAINVKDGIRQTVGSPKEGSGAPVWFFGGSTTWGYGVSDAFTYPSMFAQKTGRQVTNYGEGAYTSRQSLAYLQGLYLEEPEGNRTVVFYDGINDLMHGCNPNTTSINQTAHESRYRHALRHLDDPFTYGRLFEQLLEFAPRVSQKIGLSDPLIFEFHCAEDPEKALFAAQRLVATLKNAERLAEANGDTFIAVLQPASFISANVHPVLPDHPYNEELLAEYKVIYPLAQKLLSEAGIKYVDLSHIFDDCFDCYYDHVHAGPEGHRRLVDALVKIVP